MDEYNNELRTEVREGLVTGSLVVVKAEDRREAIQRIDALESQHTADQARIAELQNELTMWVAWHRRLLQEMKFREPQ